ncbi:hypothetical protein HN51_058543 [Arachis hypogaea]
MVGDGIDERRTATGCVEEAPQCDERRDGGRWAAESKMRGDDGGVNDNGDFGGFDECIECESEKTVTQICTGIRSGTKQLRNFNGGVGTNGFIQGREAHKVSNNGKQLLGHSTFGLEKELWFDGLLNGVQMLQVGEGQGKLSGVQREAGLGSVSPSGSGPGDLDERSQNIGSGDEDGPGQQWARGSGSEKQGRADKQQRGGYGQGQLPPCTRGSKLYEGGSTRGVLNKTSRASLSVVDAVDNRDCTLHSASRKATADYPGGAPGWPGGEAEERSLALVQCTGEEAGKTVGQKPPAPLDDEPEVESLVNEVTGQSVHGREEEEKFGKILNIIFGSLKA